MTMPVFLRRGTKQRVLIDLFVILLIKTNSKSQNISPVDLSLSNQNLKRISHHQTFRWSYHIRLPDFDLLPESQIIYAPGFPRDL
ncbi:hypothetical protein L2E82_14107 [Cichorium intybus]|uniref:Uncharacterized protein n=1 Tax=Cichorium intybus TaxID=13427 RepID=A0ACB9EZ15_CICIN|nr:hypothetical protein L2E82_14107 [Cichorium intybus]